MSNAGQNYVVGGGSGRGAWLLNNPVGAIFWVAAQAAYEGIGPSNNNSGLSPKSPLSTIAQAITNCVTGRGDRIILMPGTYSITAALALDKNAVEVYSWMPSAAVISSPATTGAATVLSIDANDILVDGVTFSCGDQVTACVDIANNAASNRIALRGNTLLGSGAVSTAKGVKIGDGTNDAADVLLDGNFIDRFLYGVVWDGTRPRILGNNIIIPSTAGSAGSHVPARGSSGESSFGGIRGNGLTGAENAGTKPVLLFSGAEASSPMYLFSENHLANVASVTADIHPEGIVMNYQGNSTATTPVLITG